jgi:hypothetical protein
LRGAFTVPIAIAPSGTRLKNYMLLFVCGKTDLAAPRTRVYFQVAEPTQADLARQIMDSVVSAVPNVTVLSDVDMRGAQSPDQTEVRFSGKGDGDTAKEIARILSQRLSQPVAAKLTPGQAKSLPTVEIWLGRKLTLPPLQPRSPAGGGLSGKEGFVYVGDVSTEGKLKHVTLASEEGSDVGLASFQAGSAYRSLLPLRLRDGQPQNDERYFNALKSLGVAPPGTTLIALSAPVVIQRQPVAQVWLAVRVAVPSSTTTSNKPN